MVVNVNDLVGLEVRQKFSEFKVQFNEYNLFLTPVPTYWGTAFSVGSVFRPVMLAITGADRNGKQFSSVYAYDINSLLMKTQLMILEVDEDSNIVRYPVEAVSRGLSDSTKEAKWNFVTCKSEKMGDGLRRFTASISNGESVISIDEDFVESIEEFVEIINGHLAKM